MQVRYEYRDNKNEVSYTFPIDAEDVITYAILFPDHNKKLHNIYNDTYINGTVRILATLISEWEEVPMDKDN